MRQSVSMKKGSVLTLPITGLAFGGKGIAKLGDFIIFVDRALPGQIVEIRISRVKHNYAEGIVKTLLTDTPEAIAAPCGHFGTCGGCLFQNLTYSKQLEYKHQQVVESFQHIGGFDDVRITPILPSPDQYYYRNKMEFSFSHSRWMTKDEIETSAPIVDKHFALGLHVHGRFDKVLNIDQCYLLSERSNRILKVINEWTRTSQLKPYSTIDNQGFWRFLVIREGKNTGESMVNIVTAELQNDYQEVDRLGDHLHALFPEITTIIHNINRRKAQIAFGDEERILHGSGYIHEKLNQYLYRISANSFFQTNSRQTENLYKRILDWGEFAENDIVYDLYSGTGSISIYVAQFVEKIVGFELIEQAIEDAEQNCQLNGVDNCTFIQGDLKTHLEQPGSLIDRFSKPDVCIIDPPRSGMHPSLPEKILALSPDRIIYISCNPTTLARDLKALCKEHYQIKKVQPIDMFPHTAHCEVIALMMKS